MWGCLGSCLAFGSDDQKLELRGYTTKNQGLFLNVIHPDVLMDTK